MFHFEYNIISKFTEITKVVFCHDSFDRLLVSALMKVCPQNQLKTTIISFKSQIILIIPRMTLSTVRMEWIIQRLQIVFNWTPWHCWRNRKLRQHATYNLVLKQKERFNFNKTFQLIRLYESIGYQISILIKSIHFLRVNNIMWPV